MARSLRAGVRNDFPGMSESKDQMINRTRDEYFNRTKPSSNKPKVQREVPPGCVSVYRVKKWDGRRTTYYGIYRDEALAYQIADAEWDEVVKPWSWSKDAHISIVVEHKATMELDGRFYLVNLQPIRFTEPPTTAALLRAPEGVTQ